MKLRLEYCASYHYEDAVSLSPHVVRLFPRDPLQCRVARFHFTTNAGAEIHWRRDLFDNVAARCFYPGEVRQLEFQLSAEVETQERNPFAFLLETRALALPVDHTDAESEVLRAFFGPATDGLPSALLPPAGSGTIETLVAMNAWIHANIAYERREEGQPHHPLETLRLGKGACRDTAVLLAAALRGAGLAARLASGYLWESMTAPGQRRAESALHAWTEVYLPGAGWVAFDPSNGVLGDHHYITAAVGLRPDDIAPVQGHYYNQRRIPHRLVTSLGIRRMAPEESP